MSDYKFTETEMAQIESDIRASEIERVINEKEKYCNLNKGYQCLEDCDNCPLDVFFKKLAEQLKEKKNE